MLAKILVVDDVKDTADSLVRELEKAGYEATAVYSQEAAFEYLLENASALQVVVTDMKMSADDSGLKVLKQATMLNPVIKVIIITAYDDSDTAFPAAQQGAAAYVKKKTEDNIYNRVVAEVRRALTTKNACVMMPFSPPCIDSNYAEIFKPALEAAGYTVTRADTPLRSTPIITSIWKMIASSDLVLCEMSHRNPNVFYELGVAHAKRKATILVARQVEDIPFDLRHVRAILYNPDEVDWKETLKAKITKAAQEEMEALHRGEHLPSWII
jgi:CheY-like chemotaxis protein